MNDQGSGARTDDGDTGSWTSETLPMSVRKELLERELKKLGFRKAGHGSHDGPYAQQQQQPQPGNAHPSAEDSAGGEHGD